MSINNGRENSIAIINNSCKPCVRLRAHVLVEVQKDQFRIHISSVTASRMQVLPVQFEVTGSDTNDLFISDFLLSLIIIKVKLLLKY